MKLINGKSIILLKINCTTLALDFKIQTSYRIDFDICANKLKAQSKMRFKIILLLSFVLIICFNTSAQNNTTTISGLIRNNASKSAIPYANVILKSVKDSLGKNKLP